jgi:hypothetical protein
MIGFDENGNIRCSKDHQQPKQVGPDCTDPTRLVPRANLQLCNLSRMNLRGKDLNHANLILANLQGSDLSESNLTGSNLSGASLSEANLQGANLSETIALNAQVGQDPTQAQGTDMSRAHLQNTNLQSAFLVGANLGEVAWANTLCPDGTNSDRDDGDDRTCRNNMVAMNLTVKDMPPIGKEGTVTNAFGISVKATIHCVTFNPDRSVSRTTTMQEVTLAPLETRTWNGSCPSIPPQFSGVTVQASPLLP